MGYPGTLLMDLEILIEFWSGTLQLYRGVYVLFSTYSKVPGGNSGPEMEWYK